MTSNYHNILLLLFIIGIVIDCFIIFFITSPSSTIFNSNNFNNNNNNKIYHHRGQANNRVQGARQQTQFETMGTIAIVPVLRENSCYAKVQSTLIVNLRCNQKFLNINTC